VWGMDNRANMHAIEVAQRAVAAADPLVDYVPTSHQGVEIGGGAGLHYHYGTIGQLEHGVSHAMAYLRSIGRAPKPSRPLASWPYAKGKPVRLFVFAGHRNMEGERAFVQDLAKLQRADLRKDNAGIAFRYSLGGGHKVSEDWEPLGPAGSHDTFGPELSFGKRVASKRRDHVAIVKFTHTGSQILDWTPAGSEAPTRNLYPGFVAFVRSAMQELAEHGHAVELAGIFYHLGENDMCFGPYRRQAAARLASIVAQSRIDLGLPELQWFVTQQRPPEEDGLGRIDVNADLAKVAAADPRLRLIQAFDLPGQEQKLVLTTAGIVALGELLADRYLDAK
jgi:Carbohydrate esterase, sialic acid-specific acetylesterase